MLTFWKLLSVFLSFSVSWCRLICGWGIWTSTNIQDSNDTVHRAALVGYTSSFSAGNSRLSSMPWNSSLKEVQKLTDQQGQYAAMVLYTLCTQLVKTAVLIFYMRLTPSRKFKIACWVVLVLITMGSIGTLPPIIFSCNPISTMWDPRLFFRVALTQIGLPDDTIDSFLSLIGGPTEDVSMRPKCLNFLMLWKSCAAINMAFDFVLLVMPLPVIYRSGIPWRQKVHVTFLFLLGVM